jgi:hypothetical protein
VRTVTSTGSGGYYTANGTMTFPEPFPDIPYVLINDEGYEGYARNVTATKFEFQYTTPVQTTITIRWVAIGFND